MKSSKVASQLGKVVNCPSTASSKRWPPLSKEARRSTVERFSTRPILNLTPLPMKKRSNSPRASLSLSPSLSNPSLLLSFCHPFMSYRFFDSFSHRSSILFFGLRFSFDAILSLEMQRNTIYCNAISENLCHELSYWKTTFQELQ